jgi:hypothetical protein
MAFVLDDAKSYATPILYIPVLQSGHFAFIAGLPFFMVTFSGFATSFFALHFTQYIDAIGLLFTSFPKYADSTQNIKQFQIE